MGQLVVYPHIYRLSEAPLALGAEISGQNLVRQTAQTTPQAAGVREYHPGDPLNRIHWPITVKKRKLIVKEFDEELQSGVWLFLDAQAGIYPQESEEQPAAVDWNLLPLKSRNFYQLPRDGFDYALSVTASLAAYYIQDKKVVGLAAYGDTLTILPSEKAWDMLVAIIGELVGLAPGDVRPELNFVTDFI